MAKTLKEVKKYELLLFVADDHPNSAKAKTNIINICEKYLNNDYNLQIVDILKNQATAIEKGVYITPMLVVAMPLPSSYLVGDFSDTTKILQTLKIGDNG